MAPASPPGTADLSRAGGESLKRSRKKFSTKEGERKFRKRRRRSREGRKKSEDIFDRGSREKVSEEEESGGKKEVG